MNKFLACGLLASAALAADTFPERKTAQVRDYVIEYSAGDEVYATALARQLPLKPTRNAPPATVPFSVAELRARRAEVLRLIAKRLALTEATPRMGETYDAFVAGFTALQSIQPLEAARRFALWRKPELLARIVAGQEVAGFKRAADGGLEFSVGSSFEFHEGERPQKAIARMRTDWSKVTWPIKIGEEESPDAEVDERLATLRENAASMSAFQSAEVQRMAVFTVLHETTESTLAGTYIRSPDRRWFCEGVANYVAFQTLRELLGADVARGYYDVDAEVARHAPQRAGVDLEHWPVMEDPKARDVPTDVNNAGYAFATKAVFDAFGDDPELLPQVLAEVRKTPLEKADINTVYAAYEKNAGKNLGDFLKR